MCFPVLIAAVCVVINSIHVSSELRFEVPVNSIIWERRIFKVSIVAVGTVIYGIHFSKEVVCFLCPCFSLSTFRIACSSRSDDVTVTWNRFHVKNLPIDSLLMSHAKNRYSNTDMRKFESSQRKLSVNLRVFISVKRVAVASLHKTWNRISVTEKQCRRRKIPTITAHFNKRERTSRWSENRSKVRETLLHRIKKINLVAVW